MTCKPETEAQRLERIATQLLAAFIAAGHFPTEGVVEDSTKAATKLIKQLDALAIAE